MKILPDPAAGSSADAAARVSTEQSSARSAAAAAAKVAESHSSASASNAVSAAQPDTNVTFRRDQNGRIYYILTDGRSGKELEEIPPEQVRSVGQGIAEYLEKEAKAKSTSRVEVKA